MPTFATTFLIRTAMVLVVIAGVCAWVGSGAVANSSRHSLRATEIALGRAVEIADDTAVVAVEVQTATAVMSGGIGLMSEAMDHVVTISTNVRRMLGLVQLYGRPLFVNVDEISGTLGNAEISLLEVGGGLLEAQTALDLAAPELTAVIVNLRAVPDDLRDARASIQAAIAQLDRQVRMWRLAISIGALGVLLLLIAFERIAQSLIVRPASAELNQP